MTNDQELGTLVIVVLKAKNLNDKYFWKQDVFAQVGLNGETKRTKVDVKGGQHPMWDEEIRVPVLKGAGDKFRKLEVSCWAKEPKKEENIGQGFVDLTETLKTGEFDDWVTLQTNGGARGEIYLEMTFFTNAPPPPAPVGLTVPKPMVSNGNLQRRPSKLSPSERLARPAYTAGPSSVSPLHPHRQQDPYNQAPNGYGQPPNGLSPPSSRGSSTSPSRAGRESPLPPVPDQLAPGHAVPSSLTAGRPKPHAAQGAPQHVPSILRPRNPKSSPTPIPGPPVEYSGVVPAPGWDESPAPSRGYTPVVPAPENYTDDGYGQRAPEPQWGSNDASSPADFSFPVPSIPGAREPTVEFSTSSYTPPGGYGGPTPPMDRHGSGGSTTSSFSPPPPSFQPPPQSFQAQPPSFQPTPPAFPQQPSYQAAPPSFQHTHSQPSYQPPDAFPAPPPQPPAKNNGDLPDPYLLARYQSPLPLPPGADNHGSRDRRTSHSQPAAPAPASQNKLQPAVPQSQPTPASMSNPDNARLQALRQVEEETARRKAQEVRDREIALKQQREEEDSRKTQEEKDREIARQLDRELNLGEAGANANGGDMPGGW
ncbi:hypothetical protein DFH06DRAFT_119272 [Mycena polygramma]|nr:hypothetical protein DFH06DRAFT_119272 [Mycena polygramma]